MSFLPLLIRALSEGAFGGEQTYVVRGATLQCSQGTDPGILNAAYSHGVYIKDKPILTVEDAVCGANANISEKHAFGLCKLQQGLPCEPQIEPGAKWTGGKEDVLIEGAPALLSNCTLTCNCKGLPGVRMSVVPGSIIVDLPTESGGVISITDDGQDA